MDNATAKWPFAIQGNPHREEVEGRCGVESLEALQAMRRDVIELLAPLEMIFGSGGDRWQSIRKQHRAGIATLIQDAHKGDKALAEAALERMANADPRHSVFCAETEARFPDWMRLKTALSEIEERIASRAAEMAMVRAEVRLAA